MSVKKIVNLQNLAEAFSASELGGEILRFEKLSGDASSREYFRLHNASGKSRILQASQPWKATESKEHSFLLMQRLLREGGMPVPAVLGSHPENGWIVLEDLGDQMMQDVSTKDRYHHAIDLIVMMQERLSKSAEVKLRFDVEKLFAEMNHTKEYLLKSYMGFSQSQCEQFLKDILGTCEYLAARSKCFTHRDYHARNLMCANDKIYMIDFQDARIGPKSYDVISLVWDPYSSMNLSERNELMQYWHSITESTEDTFQEEARMKIQRFLKAAGSFAGFKVLKDREDYLKYIEPAMQTVRSAFGDLKKKNLYTEADGRLEALLWPSR